MLSLSNAFDDDDVTEFTDRIRRFLSLDADEPVVMTAEPKIDGVSLALRYENGQLIEAAMRDADGVQKAAAEILGLKPTTLNEKIKRLKLQG